MNSPDGMVLFEFGEHRLDPAQRSLLRTNGEVVAVGPKAFDALVHLVERAGQVVERSDLVAALWPRTVVEDNNLSQTILALRRALGDSEAGQRFIVTVPRRGYQFVAPVVRRSRVIVEKKAVEERPITTGETSEVGGRLHSTRRFYRRWLAGVLIGAVVFAAGVLLLTRSLERESASRTGYSPPPRSVAVLPFRNLSPNPQDAYFAAGMHEEVLARLAKVRGLTVIARTSVMQFANDDAHSIPSVAKALNVASVMEGSVRYTADRVRVSVRLADGADGRELWGDTYEAPMQDVFEIQSTIASRIAAALRAGLTPAERNELASRPTESMPAYASYLKALVQYRAAGAIGVGMSPQVRQEVKAHLAEAITLDPRFAAALGWRAQLGADSLQFDSFEIATRAEQVAELIESVNRDARSSLALKPDVGVAYAALARTHMFQYRLADSLEVIEEGQRLAPDDTVIWQAAAVLHCMRNDPDAAIHAAERAIDLDPRNPSPLSLLSIAKRANGRYDDAVAAFNRMIELAPTAVIGYAGLARTLSSGGDTPRLRQTLKVAEQFLGSVRNFRVDLALSYASIGARSDAERLIAEFRRGMQGRYIDPGLDAMALLAVRDHARAFEVLSATVRAGRHGMDQLPLVFVRYNSWSDPVLETPEWRQLRDSLAYKGE